MLTRPVNIIGGGGITNPLTENLDFAQYKAVAMVCDNGATLPATPTKGQWFLHTPTGRNILYMYDGSDWIPIISLGTMTVYVDGTNGTDDLDKGTGTGTDAFASIQYAVDTIPGLVGGNVVINIASGTYSETVTIQGKTVCGDYTIDLIGTTTNSSSQTVSSATSRTITVSGTPFTTDSEKGKLVIITSGGGETTHKGYTGTSYWISSNTSNVLSLVGTFTTNPVNSDTIDIVTLGTSITTLIIQDGQKAVRTKYIKLLDAADYALQHNRFASAIHEAMEIDSCARCFDVNGFSYAKFHTMYIHDSDNTNNPEGFSRLGALVDSLGLWLVKGASGSTIGVISATQAHFNFRYGSIVDGYTVGVRTNLAGTCQFLNNASDVKNCTTGLQAQRLSVIFGTTSITFSGNTTDTDDNATESAHIL
jgi:hypothetical protein